MDVKSELGVVSTGYVDCGFWERVERGVGAVVDRPYSYIYQVLLMNFTKY